MVIERLSGTYTRMESVIWPSLQWGLYLFFSFADRYSQKNLFVNLTVEVLFYARINKTQGKSPLPQILFDK